MSGTRQASKGSAGQGRGDKPEGLRDTLQTAFSSVWGVSSSSSSNSSGGNGSVGAPSKTQRENKSKRASGTIRQRTRHGRSRAGKAETGAGRKQASKAAAAKGRFYWNITGFPFPLGPLLKRRTIRYEVKSSTPCMAVALAYELATLSCPPLSCMWPARRWSGDPCGALSRSRAWAAATCPPTCA